MIHGFLIIQKYNTWFEYLDGLIIDDELLNLYKPVHIGCISHDSYGSSMISMFFEPWFFLWWCFLISQFLEFFWIRWRSMPTVFVLTMPPFASLSGFVLCRLLSFALQSFAAVTHLGVYLLYSFSCLFKIEHIFKLYELCCRCELSVDVALIQLPNIWSFALLSTLCCVASLREGSFQFVTSNLHCPLLF